MYQPVKNCVCYKNLAQNKRSVNKMQASLLIKIDMQSQDSFHLLCVDRFQLKRLVKKNQARNSNEVFFSFLKILLCRKVKYEYMKIIFCDVIFERRNELIGYI